MTGNPKMSLPVTNYCMIYNWLTVYYNMRVWSVDLANLLAATVTLFWYHC